MNRSLNLLAIVLLLCTAVYAQVPSEKDTFWKTGGNLSLQFNQVALSNWQAGGENSVSGNALVTLFADYNKENWTWKNTLTMAYGLNYQGSLFIKTDDRLELESRIDRNLNKVWGASALLNFRTQFADGFNSPEDSLRISTFLAPAYTLLGLGATYKPNKKFNLFISPLTTKLTIVNDQRLANLGAFGVEAAVRDTAGNIIETGSKTRWEVGGYANLTYKTPVMENVDLQARIDLFSNYLDGNAQFVDVNSEVLLFMKVNKLLTVNLTLALIYDHDIQFDTNADGISDGPRTQFKEVLGIGFAYKFGYNAKK